MISQKTAPYAGSHALGGMAEVIAWVERVIPQPYKAESEG